MRKRWMGITELKIVSWGGKLSVLSSQIVFKAPLLRILQP